jgi:hypothetical protein
MCRECACGQDFFDDGCNPRADAWHIAETTLLGERGDVFAK